MQRTNDSILLTICFTFGIFSMSIISSAYAAQQTDSSTMQGKVLEVINVTGYTYAKVDTGSDKVWAAGPVTALKEGDQVGFSTAMPMPDFYSESLDRKFALLYFVGRFMTDATKDTAHSSGKKSAHGKPRQANKPVAGIDKLDGEKSVAEIHTEKASLNGKTVKVRGRVTRFAAYVMGKNWLHIQDSSSFDDLTVTTADIVAVGDTVVIEGQLELDKDYDYGYIYPVIVQNAQVSKE